MMNEKPIRHSRPDSVRVDAAGPAAVRALEKSASLHSAAGGGVCAGDVLPEGELSGRTTRPMTFLN